jgi:hypothetical protein
VFLVESFCCCVIRRESFCGWLMKLRQRQEVAAGLELGLGHCAIALTACEVVCAIEVTNVEGKIEVFVCHRTVVSSIDGERGGAARIAFGKPYIFMADV